MDRVVIRALDIAGALVLILVGALPMFAIAIAIRAHDGGPALFRQVRVGEGGKPFTVLKFRTMKVDDAAVGTGTVAGDGDNIAQAHLRFKRTVPGDSRITPVGRFLRPSHLDELPQILNILSGDMSFVGVRPDTPVQELDYDPSYWTMRHRFKPGLTGPAQLRSDPLTFAERTSEETRWIEDYGVKQYLAILVKTAGKVVRRSSF